MTGGNGVLSLVLNGGRIDKSTIRDRKPFREALRTRPMIHHHQETKEMTMWWWIGRELACKILFVRDG